MSLPQVTSIQAVPTLYQSLGVTPIQTVAAIPSIPDTTIPKCTDQANCFDFTVTEMVTDLCDGEECEYEICLVTSYDNKDCKKPGNGGTVDHTCKKKSGFCSPFYGGAFAEDARVPAFLQSNIPNGWTQCQRVPPGGKAEFLFKDGVGCERSGTVVDLGSGLEAECYPRPPTIATCSDEPVRAECWWRIYAPKECPNHGGGGGDPHIKRWDGKRFSFHGECDLVMIHSEEFADGKGLDLHIRTTIKKFYSFIETVALRIGNDILEISSNEVYFNNNKQAVLPSHISGYNISEEQEGASRVIRIDLHHGDRMEFKIYKQFVSVNVAARAPDFGNSVGLLGDFHSGTMLARDGKTIIALADEFGAEWQVHANEPRLFHYNRSPQLPEETCKMPTISAGRGLKEDSTLRNGAEEACGNRSPEDFDFCVFDVMATGDIGMAGAW